MVFASAAVAASPRALGALTAGLTGGSLVAADSDAATDSATSSATEEAVETAEAVVEATTDVLALAWRAGLGAIIGIALVFVLVVVLRTMGRRRVMYAELIRFCRTPMYVMAALVGAFLGGQIAFFDLSQPDWAHFVLHALLIGIILSATWVVVGAAKAVESSIVLGVRARGDIGRTKRITTQAQVLRRVAEVIIVIVGLVGVAMTFPSARVAMASLLASAGLVSVVAGLAAQSTLGNLFAGIQLATTDAIRVDDVVVVNDEQGFIEEITLSYVVVRVWDGRRLIFPSTYFTQNPFANWTRRGSQLTGTFTIDLDWRVPVAALRAEVDRIVSASTVWDGRVASVDVTDTSGSTVTVRVAVSGANNADVWTLQCQLREELVAWLQREAPYALPRTRVEVDHVEVAEDPTPEKVARLAEELVTLQQPDGGDAGEATAVQRTVADDPIEAARVRAAAKGRAKLRRARRDKVRRRRILAREAAGEEKQTTDVAHAPSSARSLSDTGQATGVISTQEQQHYLGIGKSSTDADED
ncbi:mechanosensitive ion channel family protein [Actinomyces sp. MRS3W]|uniref:mechanosensitive ion channel family protein n=1 Tax=Actinomyces sp. MRS3W TaxID=2800796 RepID=UPI0028FD3AB0|nr:mechanosensitive ion channel domain-containing protein [Actinomyces sp. MRS3W]MDU0349465.1 mechanosensitive ion channel [Actinomyces sp. MRS3W]